MKLSRREFLKAGFLGAGALMLNRFLPVTTPWEKWSQIQSQFPDAEKLGRNASNGWIEMRTRPAPGAPSVKTLHEDEVIVWLREVVGEYASISRRWIETPEGYVYAPNIQPVKNLPQQPKSDLPETAAGKGMWAEVCVPYVDFRIERDPPCAPWLTEAPFRRLYYSQVMWIDGVSTNDQGQVLYRVNEKYGNCGDVFWAAAEAFRPITEEEVAPIHVEAVEKRIEVSLSFQTLSCYEGKDEVFFTRVSTGAKFNSAGEAVDKWATPVGVHTPWRKVISIHMAGGSTGAGYDTPGIAWTTIFDPGGAAIHSTFWHNDFGTARSHGCVNCAPEDAKWIFRWAQPSLNLYPGDIDLTNVGGSTLISVVE